MSSYKDLFNINQITDLETLNSNEGTINSLTSTNFKSQTSENDNGEFKIITVNNLNVTNDLNVKNIKLNSISKGEYIYSLQDKAGIIAHLDDIKTPVNMVTIDTNQTISGQKTFEKSIILDNGILFGDKKITFQDKTGIVSLTSDLDNYVTLNTTQTLGGFKTFNNVVRFNSSLYNNEGKIITLPSNGGQLALKSDLNNYVTTNTDQTITGKKTFNSEITINNYV